MFIDNFDNIHIPETLHCTWTIISLNTHSHKHSFTQIRLHMCPQNFKVTHNYSHTNLSFECHHLNIQSSIPKSWLWKILVFSFLNDRYKRTMQKERVDKKSIGDKLFTATFSAPILLILSAHTSLVHFPFQSNLPLGSVATLTHPNPVHLGKTSHTDCHSRSNSGQL